MDPVDNLLTQLSADSSTDAEQNQRLEALHTQIRHLEQRVDIQDRTIEELKNRLEQYLARHPQTEPNAVESIGDAQQQVSELVRAYRAGAPIDLDAVDSDSPTPAQNILLLLNAMAQHLAEWKITIADSHPALASQLTEAEAVITDRLKTLRSGATPPPQPYYVDQFTGALANYELGHAVDVAEYEEFIPDFVKDRVFRDVADAVPSEAVPEQINPFLALIGWEVVPIEIGKTEADSRVHQIQDSRWTEHASGTVVTVVTPGLRRASDHRIIQKPVVIRGQ